MKVIRYTFYRIYNFYQSRWPKENPEVIATAAVMLILIYSAIAISIIIALLLGYPLMKNAKVYLFPLFVLYMTASYFLFLKDDTYKRYLVVSDYKDDPYRGFLGNLIYWSVLAMPLLLTIICITIGKKN